jgi:hypothetical protein
MHLLILAAEEAHEASPTLFYVTGGLLALWAVLVSAFGMMRHDFPGGAVASRGVIAISTLLVVAVMAASVISG